MLKTLTTLNLHAPMTQGSADLSANQMVTLNNILKEYDAQNLSPKDAHEIISKIQDTDIAVGRGLETALTDAGFGANDINQQSEALRKDLPLPPPPPPPTEGNTGTVNNEAISTLSLLLDAYDNSELSDEDWESIYNDMQKHGFDLSDQFMDIKA